MKYLKVKVVAFVLMISIGFYACQKESVGDKNKEEDFYTFQIPEGWPQPVYAFENNKLTKEGFDLGKKLFFDTKLSKDQKISCGSCHQPFAAFAQLGHFVSHGIFDRIGFRNSPALFNLNWHSSFFWDGGANHIEVQPADPFTNPDEMGLTLEEVVAIVSADENYTPLFVAAFGNDLINTERIFKALAQFMGMLVSKDAKYDKVKKGTATFSDAEQKGYAIFKQHCNACHTEPLFSDFSFRYNGLPIVLSPTGKIDSGRGRIHPYDEANMYKFKVPSLRNLAYTFPYMHDGRIASLEEVLKHYTEGIQQHPNLDPLLVNGIKLTADEKADLLVFLKTLNDETFVKERRFQEQ